MSVTEQGVADAALAAVNAPLNALNTPRTAYDVDDVPAERPKDYVEVSVTRRFGGTARNDSSLGSTGWRIAVRFVSQSSVPNARKMREIARAALEMTVLTVSGVESTPVAFEGSEEIGPDDGWFSGLDTYTTTF